MNDKRKDNLSDLIFCLCILVVGIIVGHRLFYLFNVYNGEFVKNPRCVEDEYIDAHTFKCVHIDLIDGGE